MTEIPTLASLRFVLSFVILINTPIIIIIISILLVTKTTHHSEPKLIMRLFKGCGYYFGSNPRKKQAKQQFVSYFDS